MNLLAIDRVAFSLFGVDVYWYGLIITFAIVLDFVLLTVMCKKYGYDKDMPFDLVLSAVILGIVGARLFSVIFDSGADITDFFRFRDGGMSIIGGLMGGVVGVGLYALIKKCNFFMVTDVLAPLVILAQGIGRWGNFFNQEVYGQEVLNDALKWFPYAVNIDGSWYQALFFYESILNILGCVLLIFLLKRYRKNHGITTGVYLIYYGTVRFLLEMLRDNEFILRWGKLPISKFMSGIMVLIGISIIVTSVVLTKKKKSVSTTKSNI